MAASWADEHARRDVVLPKLLPLLTFDDSSGELCLTSEAPLMEKVLEIGGVDCPVAVTESVTAGGLPTHCAAALTRPAERALHRVGRSTRWPFFTEPRSILE